MSWQYQLIAENGVQQLPIPGGSIGSQFVIISFSTPPSAGTAKLEYRIAGSTNWIVVGLNTSLLSGEAVYQFDGIVGALRVTFSGLIGGTSPQLTLSSQPTAIPPFNLMTDGGTGQNRRLRVDPGQTGFFTGKFFRSYIEALIPTAGPSVQFRFTSPIDFILWSQILELTQGAIELHVYTGATSTGTWTQRPVIGVNRMIQRPLPYYTSQITLETGGNFTGGTEVDVLKVRTAAQNNTASNVGQNISERGLPPGVYHGRLQTLTGGLTVNDAAQLVYSIIWEER